MQKKPLLTHVTCQRFPASGITRVRFFTLLYTALHIYDVLPMCKGVLHHASTLRVKYKTDFITTLKHLSFAFAFQTKSHVPAPGVFLPGF